MYDFLSSAHFFQNKLFKNCFRDTISVSRWMAVRFVGPDLDPNCLQTLSADYSISADHSSRQGVIILQVHYSDVCKCHTVLTISLLAATCRMLISLQTVWTQIRKREHLSRSGFKPF